LNGVNLPEMPYIIDLKRGMSRGQTGKGTTGMVRIIKAIVVLAILGLAGLTGYAYLADLSPVQVDHSQPVTLNVD
jgi:hypothetical protein